MQTQYREGKQSTVTHLGRQYLVDDLLDQCAGKLPMLLKVSDLTWILGETEVDAERASVADSRFPLIVLQEKSGRYIVLDGVHRLTKLKSQYAVFARCHVIYEDQLIKH